MTETTTKATKAGRPHGSKDRLYRPTLRLRNQAVRTLAERAGDGDPSAASLLVALEIVRDLRLNLLEPQGRG